MVRRDLMDRQISTSETPINSLRRRPFLMPLWLLASTAAVGGVLLILAAWLWLTADSTEIIVVRAAEDEARAALLARMFGDARQPGHLDAIYVPSRADERSTAAPLAAQLGLTPTVATDADPRELARRVLREHPGGRILVIGQGDAVATIVTALSHSKSIPALAASVHGTMYIVTVPRIGRANVLRLNY
jgi:broad specificity phosphatase PhoE